VARLDGLPRSGDGRRTLGIARRRRCPLCVPSEAFGTYRIAAALVAGSLVHFSVGRRITHGMIGGALGAVAALAILYVTFFREGRRRFQR
jgi:hypothetical protein